MGIDTIKVTYAYIIATVMIAGGMWFLFSSRNDPPGSHTDALIPVVTGFILLAAQWVFQRETQTGTARQVERGIAAGAKTTADATTAAAAAPTQTITAPTADTVNVSQTPSE